MAKKKTTKRRSTSRAVTTYRRAKRMTVPMAVVGGFVPVIAGVWNRRDSATAMGDYLQRGFTGIEPGTNQFSLGNLRLGAVPIAAGFFVHTIASKLGLNRVLARTGIPLIRI